MKSLKRLFVCFLAAALLVGMVSFTKAEAALSRPGRCRFSSWTDSRFTSCRIKWDSVSGANRYRLVVTRVDGSHYKEYKTTSTSYHLKNLEKRVYVVKVMAESVNDLGQTVNTSTFSNVAYIVPMPTQMSATISNDGSIKVKLNWNLIKGCRGYNVFLTTNPNNDSWIWNQATDTSSTATSATVKKFKRQNLKKFQNYYVRIVTRMKHNVCSWEPLSLGVAYYSALL